MAKQTDNPLTNANKLIAERLKQERNRLEWTQAELAEKAGIGRSAIVHYEQGNAIPGGIELMKLARAFNRSPNYLLSGSDNFFNTTSAELALISDDPNQVVMRAAMCFAVLDKEAQEAFSALLMTLVRAKLNKRAYEEFVRHFKTMSQLIPEMAPGVVEAAEKTMANQTAAKAKARARRKA